jgi:hypothetical protein
MALSGDRVELPGHAGNMPAGSRGRPPERKSAGDDLLEGDERGHRAVLREGQDQAGRRWSCILGGTFPMRLPQINFDCFDVRATKGGLGTTKSSVAAMPEAGRLGKVFHP